MPVSTNDLRFAAEILDPSNAALARMLREAAAELDAARLRLMAVDERTRRKL